MRRQSRRASLNTGGKMSEIKGQEEQGRKLEDIRKESEGKLCPVQKSLYFVSEFLAGPMCGKCYPCALGTNEARIRLIRLSQHLPGVSEDDIATVRRIAERMVVGSFCKKGKDTGKFLLEVLDASGDEFSQHASGICPKKECISLVEYVINSDLCIMCGKCAEICKYGAILGQKAEPYRTGYLPFEIRQKRCVKCGECVDICPTGAIEVTTVEVEELVSTE